MLKKILLLYSVIYILSLYTSANKENPPKIELSEKQKKNFSIILQAYQLLNKQKKK